MACAVPCVVTDVGDSAQIVGDTGRAVPPRDPDAMAAAIAELLSLPGRQRQLLGATARERVRSHFGLSAIAMRYTTLYEAMLGDRVTRH
jgi:glycosyltransferase involved in cell wall biosynthesis